MNKLRFINCPPTKDQLCMAKKLVRQAKVYCMFIGWPRSGSCITGALLDAHKNAVVAHELKALRYIEKLPMDKLRLFDYLVRKTHMFVDNNYKAGKYRYFVEGQYQGYCNDAHVIGDKGGEASKLQYIKQLRQIIQMPICFIQVVRNPFDNISTYVLKNVEKTKAKVTNDLIGVYIKKYFDICVKIEDARLGIKNEEIQLVKHEDLINDPVLVLTNLCNFLELEPYESYLEACSKLIYTKANKTRFRVPWTKDLKMQVIDKMKKYSFMPEYSFDD